MRTLNRLNLLMNTLRISGNEMADCLHVDNSLVSKWRNGRRELRPDTVYMADILRYVVKLDEPGGYPRLRSLLGQEFPENDPSSGELEAVLRRWLSAPVSAEEQYSAVQSPVGRMCAGVEKTDDYLLHGSIGARQGSRILMKMAEESGDPNELILLSNSSMDWLFENKEFFSEWVRFCKKIAASGSLKIFVPVVNPYRVLSDILLRQVGIFALKNVKTVFIPKYKDDTFYYTILLLRRKMALQCFSTNPASDDALFRLSADSRVVGDLEKLAESFLSRSRPLFNQYDFGAYNKYVNEIIGTQESGASQYQYGYPAPLFIEAETLTEILKENRISGGEYEEMYHVLSTLNSRAQSRCFVDLDRVARALNKDKVEIPRLSYLIGKPIRVSSGLFRRMMEESIAAIERSDQTEVGLESLDESYGLGDAEVIAKENLCVYYRTVGSPRPVVLEMKEMTCVMSVYSELEAVWNGIPRLNRNKEFCLRKLRELLNRTEQER